MTITESNADSEARALLMPVIAKARADGSPRNPACGLSAARTIKKDGTHVWEVVFKADQTMVVIHDADEGDTTDGGMTDDEVADVILRCWRSELDTHED